MDKIVAIIGHPIKTPPLRAYVFSSVIDNKRNLSTEKLEALCGPAHYQLISILYHSPMHEAAKKFNYVLAFLWKNQQDMNIDVFGYHGIKDWKKDNPEICSWLFTNGAYHPGRDIACETGAIILGNEGLHRRDHTTTLEEYMMSVPRCDSIHREVPPGVAEMFCFRK